MVLFCDYAFTAAINGTAGADGIGRAHVIMGACGLVVAVIFLWLASRSDRWWPLPVTGCLILNLMIHLLVLLTPVSLYAAISAQVGLWLLLYVTLLVGVSERWLAGEAAVSRVGPIPGRRTALAGQA